jgi:hypothetical protein
VLEIHTTVMLLSSLPQYAPRRSFCLGHEHAPTMMRPRRRWRILPDPGPSISLAPTGLEPNARPLPAPVGAAPYAGWLPGMQAAALLIGALLLFVTVGDLAGIVPGSQPEVRLAAPTAAADTQRAALPPPEAAPAPSGAAMSDREGETASEPAMFESVSSTETSGATSVDEGTSSGDSASEEVLADEEPAPTPRLMATMVVAAAVTQPVPTPIVAMARDADRPATAPTSAPAAEASTDQPTRLRMVQLVLALALGWLVVSIVGLKRVRS